MLTQLRNRRVFMQKNSIALRARPWPFAVIAIDPRPGKAINDEQATRWVTPCCARAGEVLLRRLSMRQLAARVGGDEFAVLPG